MVRLRLRQAFGRLIRRTSDRGVFVLLDPRVPSRLLSAFPTGVSVRLGKVEGTEASESEDVSLRVFVGQRVASVSATATSDPKSLAERAVSMAKVSPEDPYQALADPSLLARTPVDLDLFDATEIGAERLCREDRPAGGDRA